MIGASSGLTISDVSALYFFIFLSLFFSLFGLLALVTSVIVSCAFSEVPFVNAFAARTSDVSESCFFSFFFFSLFGVLTLLTTFVPSVLAGSVGTAFEGFSDVSAAVFSRARLV
jgi:hypothetical protein